MNEVVSATNEGGVELLSLDQHQNHLPQISNSHHQMMETTFGRSEESVMQYNYVINDNTSSDRRTGQTDSVLMRLHNN